MTEAPFASEHRLTTSPVSDGRYIPIELPSRRQTDADGGSAPASGPRLVRTVTEAATMLGISRAFAYRLVKTGELRHIRLGRRVLVPYKAILELVDEHAAPPRDSKARSGSRHSDPTPPVDPVA